MDGMGWETDKYQHNVEDNSIQLQWDVLTS